MADDTGPSGDLVAALREPSFWDARGPVELRETHISWVFLAGERAYKLKKPLRLPFLDYSTLERRREMCEEEVRGQPAAGARPLPRRARDLSARRTARS